jgi:hypothetical protein
MKETPFTLTELLENFILIERMQFDIDHNNRFGFAFGKVQQYHTFLRLILERYRVGTTEAAGLEARRWRFLKQTMESGPSGSAGLTAEELEVRDLCFAATTKLHLEIESFYVFAKILLDQIARAIQVFFGQGQGCKLSSHDQFLKHFEKYMHLKQLEVPKGYLEHAELLRTTISDYRDKQIEHQQDPDRFAGVSYSMDFQPKVASQRIEGTLETFKSTEGLEQLFVRVEEYVLLFLTLTRDNKTKSALRPNPELQKFSTARSLGDLVNLPESQQKPEHS